MAVKPPHVDTLENGADVTDYRRLVLELRRERKRQGLSCEALDELAGLPERYINKLENWGRSGPGRGMGDVSLPLVLQSLGLRLMLMRSDEPRRRRRRKTA